MRGHIRDTALHARRSSLRRVRDGCGVRTRNAPLRPRLFRVRGLPRFTRLRPGNCVRRDRSRLSLSTLHAGAVRSLAETGSAPWTVTAPVESMLTAKCWSGDLAGPDLTPPF